MKFHFTSILVLVFISTITLQAQIPNIKFIQGDTIPYVKGKKDYYEMDLKQEAFTILFEGSELHVCAGIDEGLFRFTQPNTDINADVNSYFFIFKYLAGTENTDFLSIEKDTGNSLNETHGAKSAGAGMSKFTVRSLMDEGDLQPLTEFRKLFLALWLDANKDQLVDKEELIWVKANIKKK